MFISIIDLSPKFSINCSFKFIKLVLMINWRFTETNSVQFNSLITFSSYSDSQHFIFRMSVPEKKKETYVV